MDLCCSLPPAQLRRLFPAHSSPWQGPRGLVEPSLQLLPPPVGLKTFGEGGGSGFASWMGIYDCSGTFLLHSPLLCSDRISQATRTHCRARYG